MKEKKELSWLSQDKVDKNLFYLILLFLPTQLGFHFWPNFSYVLGVRVDYLSPTLYLTDVLISLLFLVVVYKGKINLKPNLYFSFFLVLLLTSSLLSKSFEISLLAILKFLEFSFLAYFVYKKIKIDSTFLRTFSIGVLFESILSILQFLNKGSLQGPFYFLGERLYNSQTPDVANASLNGELFLRSYGTFSHPNVLAAYLLLGICFIIFFGDFRNKNSRILFALSVGAGAIGLVLTLGRAAIIGFVMAVLFKLPTFIKNKSAKGVFILAIGLIFFSMLLIPFSSRFTAIGLSDESIVKRQELISSSFLMIKDNFIFGVGPNNFLTELPSYFEGVKKVFYLQPVHNIYLLFISELGIFAFLLALVFVIKAFLRTNIKMKAILLITLFLGFFDHYFLTLQQGQLLLSLVIAFSFGYTQRKKDLIK